MKHRVNPALPLLTSDKSRLVQFSFLMLFVELTLIRWTGAHVYYVFAYANLVLMASFLGIGLGFLRSRTSRHSFRFAPILLVIFYLFLLHPQL